MKAKSVCCEYEAVVTVENELIGSAAHWLHHRAPPRSSATELSLGQLLLAAGARGRTDTLVPVSLSRACSDCTPQEGARKEDRKKKESTVLQDVMQPNTSTKQSVYESCIHQACLTGLWEGKVGP